MPEFLIYILFVVGFVFLIKGADLLVSGSAALAKRFNISNMVIGLTIVSLGTSMPEMIINIISSVKGNTDIAIGNVFGSNIANILLILGISAIICPLPIRRNTILSEIPFSLTAALLVGFLANMILTKGEDDPFISRTDGIILLFFFTFFMAYIFNLAKTDKDTVENGDFKRMAVWKSSLFIVLGIIGLFFGGKWVVRGAVHIAGGLGLSESFIGLTIVAIGTSLPELVTSAMAAYRKDIDIAVGNVVGSNIFNLLWVLGLSATINPLPFNYNNNLDLLVMIFASTLLILSLAVGKRNAIDRYNGIFFLLVYAGYIYYLLQRDA